MKKIYLAPLLLAISISGALVYAVSPTPVNLGSADNFAILASSTITNIGSSVVTGDLGLSPGSAVTGFPPGILNGTQHVANTGAILAQTDLVNAYTDLAGRTPVSTIGSELGGTTKTPGVYDSLDGKFGITGTLTLDAQGDADAVFIFKTATTLTTEWASKIVLIGKAQACKVFWLVGSSATLGTNSSFKGNILALTSATLTTGVNLEGRVLARNGAVTLDSSTIVKAVCTIPPAPVAVVTPAEPLAQPTIFTGTTASTGTIASTGTTVSTDTTIVPPVTVTAAPVVIAPAATPVITPKMPNTGFAPEESNTPWTVIISFGILTSLLAFYIIRKESI